jgi:hypothetical protein
MAQGDEYQAGEPRRSQPGWRDEDYDEERADRDVGQRTRRRSGAVTTVGILAIVFGCFVLLGSVCLSVYPVIMSTTLEFAGKVNPNDPNLAKAKEAAAKVPTWYFLGVAAVDFIRSLGLIVGGVGVLRRSSWGRLLTLAMASLGIIMFMIGCGASFAFGAIDPADPSSIAGGVFGIVCSAIVNLGFAGCVFPILLSGKNVAEFRN